MSVTLMNNKDGNRSNIIFGVLTCQNKELALIRSGLDMKKNKGYEAGFSAVYQLES